MLWSIDKKECFFLYTPRPTMHGHKVTGHRGLSYLLGVWLGHFYDLAGQNFFMPNNGLGGFLGSHWKVFHHGTLRNHFQRVCRAFWSWPIGEKMAFPGRKVAKLFLLKNVYPWVTDTCKGYQIKGNKKSCQEMPKNILKMVYLVKINIK